VTGMARFWSSQTWVMPTFSPTIALVAIVLPELGEVVPRGRSARAKRARRSEDRLCLGVPGSATEDVDWTVEREAP
jgi:hypothetical protein